MACAALAAVAQAPAPPLSVTVKVNNAIAEPPQPVKAAHVSLTHLVGTQVVVDAPGPTNPRGEAQLLISQSAARRGDLRFVISGVGDLVIYQPADGQLIGVIGPTVKTITVSLLPKGTAKLLEQPGLAQALLHRMALQIARQQKQIKALQGQPGATGQPPVGSQKPDLGAALDEWASTNGFSSEQVKVMVQKWVDEIEKKGGAARKEELGLAESALQHYDNAAHLFHQASDADLQEANAVTEQLQAENARLKTLEAQLKTAQAAQQALHDKRLSSLQNMLDHRKEEADAYQAGDKYHQAAQALQSTAATLATVHAADPGDKDLHELWLDAVSDVADAIGDEEEKAEGDEAEGKIPVGSQAVVLLHQLEETDELLAREHLALDDQADAASAEDKLADALSDEAGYVSEDKALILAGQIITAYSNALEAYTKSGNADDSLRTQMNLAATWMEIGESQSGRQKAASFNEAVQGYQKAVDACAKARSNECDQLKPEIALGQALKEEGQPAAAEKALALFDQAVQTYRQELATYQNKLQAYARTYGRQDSTTLQLWADTEHHLGDALEKEAMVVTNDKALSLFDQAVQAYQHAHEYYTKVQIPESKYAELETDRGKTLRIESQHTSGDKAVVLLDQAVQAYRNALQCYPKADQPGDCAEEKMDLGVTLWLEAEYVDGDKANALLDQAMMVFQPLLEAYTQTGSPSEYVPLLQLFLGTALGSEGIRAGDDKAPALLDQAVRTCNNALKVLPRTESPDGWADIQVALGNALADKGLREGADQSASFDQAIEALRNAIEASSENDSSGQHSRMQVSLANIDLVAGRFGACFEQARTIPGESLAPDAVIIRDTVKLACEFGAGNKSAALATAKAIQPMTAAQPGVLWTGAWNSSAAIYYLSHSPSFAAGRSSWLALFTAVHNGDSAAITAALHQLEPILQQ